MGTVLVNVSISLDGFLAGPNVSVENPMGEGGHRVHDWMFGDAQDEVDASVLKAMEGTVGAAVVGRRTFDVGRGPWGDTPYPAPTFVVTHRAHDDLPMKSGTFHFVTDGPASAVRQAKAAAGGKDVTVLGADITRQLLRAGLLDEMYVHLVPVLLGTGVLLFEHLGGEHIELEQVSTVASADVTHVRYRVLK